MNKQEIRQLLEEVYFEVLEENLVKEETLKTSTQMILGKFPTLRDTIEKLLTKEYDHFIDEIHWVSPKPSTFKVQFKSGQSFILKWLGKGFQAQVEGKRFFLNNVSEYQSALDRINELLKNGPVSAADEFGEDGGFDDSGAFDSEPAPDSGTTDAEGEDVFDTGEE